MLTGLSPQAIDNGAKGALKAQHIEAFKILGLDTDYHAFCKLVKKNYRREPAESSFYNLRKELRDEAEAAAKNPSRLTPTIAKTAQDVVHKQYPNGHLAKTVAATDKVGMRSLAELPQLLIAARTLLEDFDGDKESLIDFIRAL